MEELNPQESLGERFALVRRLGRGGMGEVWLARDLELDEAVALKVLRPELVASEAALAALRAECRLARRLAHPNIVRLYDLHRARGTVFLSMQYVEGGDLQSLRRSDWITVLRLLLPVAEALVYAHDQGIVHRDLKPTNVLLDALQWPRLADFGIGGMAGESLRSVAGGSPYTMSPQQLAGQPPCVADDVYGFGTLLYEMLYGRPPGQTSGGEDPAPGPVEPLPKTLDRLLVGALADAPGDRPPDMASVRGTLQTLLADSENQTVPPQESTRGGDVTAAERVRHEPPTVVLPPAGPSETDNRSRTVAMALGAMFIGLVGLGAAVFFYLPSMVAEQSLPPAVESPGPAASTVTRSLPVDDVAADAGAEDRLRQQREEAENALRDLTELRQRLDELAVTEWAAEDYAAVLETIAAADEQFLQQQFEAATNTYRAAAEALAAIEGQVAEVLQSALAEGAAALAAGDADAARRAYTLASRLDPENAQVQQGLRRSATLEQVLALLAEGSEQERAGEFEQAAGTYRRALELDPDAARARDALVAVEGKAEASAFAAAMSEGLNALDSGNLQAARSALGRAQALKPDAPEVKDALARVALQARLQQIAGLKARAGRHEDQQRWAEAERLYAEALALDSTLVFAREGVERSGQYARLTASMDGFLTDTSRLYSQPARLQARQLTAEVGKLRDPPASIVQRRERLEDQIEIAARPLAVELLSDNETEVTVFRIGRLGRFERHRLELPPGTYTVVGSRSGFRDVRHTLTLRPGNRLDPLMVRCEERV